MTSDGVKDGIRRFSTDEKIANSDRAARQIIAKENAQRASKSDRLRQARLAQEAERSPLVEKPKKSRAQIRKP
jgi:hypothetical protein